MRDLVRYEGAKGFDGRKEFMVSDQVEARIVNESHRTRQFIDNVQLLSDELSELLDWNPGAIEHSLVGDDGITMFRSVHYVACPNHPDGEPVNEDPRTYPCTARGLLAVLPLEIRPPAHS